LQLNVHEVNKEMQLKKSHNNKINSCTYTDNESRSLCDWDQQF